MNKVTRGERLLNKLAGDGVITQCGKDWLTAAFDPMHDTQLSDLQGWPDVETAPSVVRQIKQSVSLTAPVGITSSTWDCHIVQWPWLTQTQFAQSAPRFGNTLTNNVAPAPNTNQYGGVQAFATDPAIAADFVPGAQLGVQSAPLATVDLSDPEYSRGTNRCVGMGWEVVNTTSELNKQGAVVPYRLPEPRTSPQTFSVNSVGYGSGQIFRPPPTSTASAMLIPGSRQWAAKDGVYCVVPFVGQDNPPLAADYIQPMIAVKETLEDTVQSTSSSASLGTNVNIGAVLCPKQALDGAQTSFIANKIYPLHQTGAVFTGLSLQTTLQLTVIYYMESFPGLAEKSILVLAKPSCSYDPRALQIFSEALRTLPVAVPAGMNGLGDWFADAVLTASEFVTPIAKALGMDTIANVSKVAGKTASRYLAASSPQDKPTTGQMMAAQRKVKNKKAKAKNKQSAQSKQITGK